MSMLSFGHQFHRQPAVADAVIVNFRRQFFPLKSRRGFYRKKAYYGWGGRYNSLLWLLFSGGVYRSQKTHCCDENTGVQLDEQTHGLGTQGKIQKSVQRYRVVQRWVPRFKSGPWQAQTSALNYALLLSAVGNRHLFLCRRDMPS